jgi:hypothetical protein
MQRRIVHKCCHTALALRAGSRASVPKAESRSRRDGSSCSGPRAPVVHTTAQRFWCDCALLLSTTRKPRLQVFPPGPSAQNWSAPKVAGSRASTRRPRGVARAAALMSRASIPPPQSGHRWFNFSRCLTPSGDRGLIAPLSIWCESQLLFQVPRDIDDRDACFRRA